MPVPLLATAANALWSASNLPSYMRLRSALREPQTVQHRKLLHYIEQNAETAFGKAHGFQEIGSYEDFMNHVPLADYTALEPWIERIRHGETNVLTRERVTHLIPTSGSTGARKLIPFTAGLQKEFNAGIGPWMVDLQRQFPGVIGGPAYWSITPALQDGEREESCVPIGFEADTAYLGGVKQRLTSFIMAVPPEVQRASSLEEFRYQTLFHLLRCRELRLISVWHPSFLTLLLDALPQHWERLAQALPHLQGANRHEPESLWPALRVISCWGDAAAELSATHLQKRFPNVAIQPKGLLATEAFVTLPFAGEHPLAIQSHFFEFIDDNGRIQTVDELKEGEDYEVVVTTAGGLYRYRLGDRVAVTGRIGNTPSLRFLGRNGNISDRCGEKLSEQFVLQVFKEVFGDNILSFAILAPDEDITGCRYTLYMEGPCKSDWPEALDLALKRNPHYAYCRELGQLQSPKLFRIYDGGYETFLRRQSRTGARLGDIKPSALSKLAGWSVAFSGSYVKEGPAALA